MSGLTIQSQKNQFCGAHALNNLFHNCPTRHLYQNLHFTFEDPKVKSTATHINMNNICYKAFIKRLKLFGLYNNKKIDYVALERDLPDWEADFGCDPREGDFSEEIIFQTLKKVRFKKRQIWPPREITEEKMRRFNEDINNGLYQNNNPIGYLINTIRPKHWICAVFINGTLYTIDSIGSRVKKFKLTSNFRSIYEIYPRQ